MTVALEHRRCEHVASFLGSPDVGVAGQEVVRLSGPALELRERVIARLRGLGIEFGAEERSYPVLLPTAALARTEYFLSFPHQATFAATIDPSALPGFVAELERGETTATTARRMQLAKPDDILSPAVCYHCYLELGGHQLDAPLRVVQATGRCFRRETGDACRPLARQREFTMHEIILLGDEQKVKDARAALTDRVMGIAARAGLHGELQPAQDAFYGSVRGRALGMMQRVTSSKLELVVEAGEGPLAIASFNLHGDYFGRAFEISNEHGALFSGCVAFGIERWMRALVAVHGPNPEACWQALAN
jgi:hypothetical protein